MRRILRVVREAFLMSRGQPVLAGVAVILVGSVCAAVLSTTGQTAAQEQAVLRSIDTPSARTIVVRADGAGLRTDSLQRIRRIQRVDWAAGLGAASDVTNDALPGGAPVAMRTSYGLPGASARRTGSGIGGVLISRRAALTLGLTSAAGAVNVVDSGAVLPVVGTAAVPASASFLQPLVLRPSAEQASSKPIAVILVATDSLASVPAVATAVQSDLTVEDPSKVTVSTSTTLAQISSLVQEQLSASNQALLVTTFTVVGLLEGVSLTALVLMRRKDFGRRRALGASRPMIAALVLMQTLQLAVSGIVLGTSTVDVYQLETHQPVAESMYQAAVAVLALALAAIATIPPLIVALTREPSSELRVP